MFHTFTAALHHAASIVPRYAGQALTSARTEHAAQWLAPFIEDTRSYSPIDIDYMRDMLSGRLAYKAYEISTDTPPGQTVIPDYMGLIFAFTLPNGSPAFIYAFAA